MRKKSAKRQKRERKEARLARKHRLEFSQSLFASQAQSSSALHAIANAFVTNWGEQPLPQPQIPAPPVFPSISLESSDSSSSNEDDEEQNKSSDENNENDDSNDGDAEEA